LPTLRRGFCTVRPSFCTTRLCIPSPLRQAPSAQDTEHICDLPVDPGHCKAYIVRYYYNRATNRCQKFIYGGCKGNGNNFKTLEQCQKTCEREAAPARFKTALQREPPDVCRLPRDPGPCKAFRTRTFYNVTSKACERFQYGGCGGNKNNFVNPELCLRTCQRPGGGDTLTTRSTGSPIPQSTRPFNFHKTPEVCTLPADGGLCFMLEERWYFDHEEKKCQPFSWGGCGGNENNFGSRPECESACKAAKWRGGHVSGKRGA
uniref:Tissue factor pathway inhibitor n=1 Tax=Varanus komodoensis TaxID=61221 RepID=A0A8D2KZ61_VARKO